MATVTSHAARFEMDSEELAVLVLETAQSPLVLWDNERVPLVFNAATPVVFGYSAEEFNSLHLLDLVHPDERAAAQRQADERNAGDFSEQRFRRRMVTKDGRVLHMDCMSSAIPLSGGRLGVIIDYHDVSEQVEAESRMRQQEALYRGIFEHAEMPIFTTDAENRLATANPAACELFGLMPTDLKRTNPLAFVHRDYRGEIERWISAEGAAEEAGGEFEVPIRVAEGNHRLFSVDLNPIHRPDGEFNGLHGFLRDVTVERRERERLQTEASTDPLTGLANRRLFDQTLSEEFDAARRQQIPLSLLMLDLDHFKQVNDEHGHPAGDAVLKNVARALKRVAHRDDLVARTGGEEFAIVLHETDGPGAEAAAERCLTAIRETDTNWGDESLQITISVGVAAFNASAHARPEQLVARADAALYEAKQSGRDRVSIADQETEQQVA